jgi:tRNA-modifying protein YgfZ
MSSADEYHALRHAAGIIDVTRSRARLLLTGADRRTYLQGLLTNDIVALTAGTGCYAAYLTAQGRMIADMRVFELGDALLVELDASAGESVRGKWELFIFSEDVRIEDWSKPMAQIGVYGPRAAEILSHVAGDRDVSPASFAARLDSMPLHGNARVTFENTPLILLRGDEAGVPGFDVVVPAAAAITLETRLLAAGGVTVSADAVELSRVEAGRPRFGIDMTADTIPLEAGIENRAISLTKGCYVGQEIIIRVLHRGQGRVARRLVGLSLAGSHAVPQQGALVHAGEREVGAVTSAVDSPALGHAIALAYVHRDFTAAGTALTVDETAATVTALPFV